MWLLVVLACAGTQPAAGYEVETTAGGKEIKWESPLAAFRADLAGGPPASAAAFQAAMGTWTAVPTSSFVFSYEGEEAGTCGLMDRVNRFCFGPAEDTGMVAENTFWYSTLTGFLIDSDIHFNTTHAFRTESAPDAYDLQNVATHELGHTLSLSDLYGPADVWKTMYGYVSFGETQKRTLDPDDIEGISHLYPAASPDLAPPETTILDGPAGTLAERDVTFTYSGSDDRTPAAELTFATRLEGLEAEWSPWTWEGSRSFSALPDGAYTFRVKARDNAGNEDPTPAQRGFAVRGVPLKPPSVITGEAIDIAADRATVTGLVNPHGGPASYFFEYGAEVPYAASTLAANTEGGEENIAVSAVVGGLRPYASYHYHLVASNARGTSYGEDRAFVTLAAPPWVVTGEAADITRRSATLKGTINPRGAPTSYTFELGAEGENPRVYDMPGTLLGRESLAVDLQVDGLLPDTAYRFRIVARNEGGPSEGDMRTFQTAPKAPDLAPVYRLLLQEVPP